MKSLRVVLLSAGVMLATGNLFAQTADEIVNKHIEALGGKAKLNAIKTIYTEYDIDMQGNQASGVSYIINGKGIRNEMDFGGQKIVQCFTDKGGWMLTPGQTTPTTLPEDQVKTQKDQFNVGGPLLDYASKGNKIELQGRETLGTVNAYKLKVTNKDSIQSTMWIDPTTWYLLKSSIKTNANGQDVEVNIAFSNYAKTEYGFVMPSNTEVSLPGMTVTLTNKKVEINKEVDPKLLEMQK
jgi:outer membrane lipoprotein-sorting protein